MPVPQPKTVDATFYAQVEPSWSSWQTGPDGAKLLEAAKVVAITQKRPERPRRGVVICKLTLRLPASAFLPLTPEAIVVVPEGATEVIHVEVDPDPTDGVCRRCADVHPDQGCADAGCTHNCEAEVSRG